LEVNEEVESLLDEGTGAKSVGKEGRLIKKNLGEYAVLVRKKGNRNKKRIWLQGNLAINRRITKTRGQS
jgi:hypothetical protein